MSAASTFDDRCSTRVWPTALPTAFTAFVTFLRGAGHPVVHDADRGQGIQHVDLWLHFCIRFDVRREAKCDADVDIEDLHNKWECGIDAPWAFHLYEADRYWYMTQHCYGQSRLEWITHKHGSTLPHGWPWDQPLRPHLWKTLREMRSTYWNGLEPSGNRI